MTHHVLIEILATSIDGVRTAVAAGADRIELCANLVEGGTTPSAGLIEEAVDIGRLAGIPIMVMIRPRGGDFVYDASEVDVMLADLRVGRKIGAGGFVLGCLTSSGLVDTTLTHQLVEAAGGRDVTFHRAVDATPDPVAGAAAAFASGCRRVLSSGGASNAMEGIPVLRRMVADAPAGKSIIVGGGVRPGSVRYLVEETAATEVHASLRTHSLRAHASGESALGPMPDWPAHSWPVPDSSAIQELRRILD